MQKLAAALLLVAAACGGDDGGTTITMTKSDAGKALVPDVLAYREAGDTAWTELPAGKLAFSVSGRAYEVALACTDTTTGSSAVRHFNIHYLRTVDDPHTFALGCDGNYVTTPPEPPAQSHLTGTMVQAGELAIGDVAGNGGADVSSEDANWAIDVTAPTTATTLIAVDDVYSHAIVRRDFDASAAETDLGTLDVDAQGTALASHTLSLANVAADESVTADLTWFFGNAAILFGAYDDSGTALTVLPDAMLADGDVQDWYVTAEVTAAQAATAQTTRGIELDYRSTTPSSYTLLDPLAGAAFAGTKLTWTSMPAVDEITLFNRTFGTQDGSTAETLVEVTPSAAAEATSLDADVTDFPHYVPAWTPAGDDIYTAFFGSRYLDAGHYNNAWVSAEPVSASAAASRRRRTPRVHGQQLAGPRAK